MANLVCAKPLQGETLRATRLDSCGDPEFGTDAFGTSDGYIEATLTPNVEAPDEFKQKGANGKFIVNQRSRPLLNWYDISVQFQEVDPELFTLLTGLDPCVDSQDRTIGFIVTEEKFATANFALELWIGNAEEPCPPSGVREPFFGYSLLPWVVEGALGGDVTIANGLITFTINGRTRAGTPWGAGPYDVVLDENGDPAELPCPIPDDTHKLQIWTQLPPPEPVCGLQTLTS